jgi:hypothetical protein
MQMGVIGKTRRSLQDILHECLVLGEGGRIETSQKEIRKIFLFHVCLLEFEF